MNLPALSLLQSRYELQHILEQDARGARYRGLDLRLGREVSVRTFPLPLPQADEDYRAMDARTSQVAVLRVQGIELFLDMGFHQRQGFVVSEWTSTGHLGDLLKRGPLPWPRARALTQELLRILGTAHRVGVPHGRLCASAVIVGAEDQVTVRDFALGPTDLPPADAPGPPEGEPLLSIEGDLHACGMLLKRMLGPDPDPASAPWLLGLLHPDPASRRAFALGLERAVEPEPPARSLAQGWRPWALGSLGALLVGLLAWGSLRERTSQITHPDSESAFRQAQFSLAKRTSVDLQKAEEGFLEALRLDRTDHRAFSGLAITYALQGVHGVLPVQAAKDQARQAASAALALHPGDGEATAVLAYLAFRYEWNWELAGSLFRTAVAQAPRSPLVRHWHGFFLSTAGRHREALDELREAARLDPVDLQILTNLGVAEAWSGDVEAGTATLRRVLDLDRTFTSATDRLVVTLEFQGRLEEAMQASQGLVRMGRVSQESLAALERAYRSGGPAGYFRERITQDGGIPSVGAAAHLALMGRKDDAFQVLQTCFQRQDLFLVWMPSDPAFRPLHEDPRFRAFLQALRHPSVQ